MVKKIAIEEHCLFPGLQEYWEPTVTGLPANKRQASLARLTDFGEMRLEAMDKAGIERCVLSVAGPGVQAERDTKTACDKAREANDLLAREIDKRPKRYSGFAHLAMQDAAAAADELERCMRELKFCGAMINGHTNGKYLDDRAFDPFWERAQALGALIYLHPPTPSRPRPCSKGTTGCGAPPGNGLSRPARTLCASCSAACSIAFPRAKLALGHLGETIPFLLWRFDSRSGPDFYAVKLAKRPSQYIKENIVVATSGMCSAEPLNCTHQRARPRPRDVRRRLSVRIGRGSGDISSTACRSTSGVRNDICFNNAARLLKLPRE